MMFAEDSGQGHDPLQATFTFSHAATHEFGYSTPSLPQTGSRLAAQTQDCSSMGFAVDLLQGHGPLQATSTSSHPAAQLFGYSTPSLPQTGSKMKEQTQDGSTVGWSVDLLQGHEPLQATSTLSHAATHEFGYSIPSLPQTGSKMVAQTQDGSSMVLTLDLLQGHGPSQAISILSHSAAHALEYSTPSLPQTGS